MTQRVRGLYARHPGLRDADLPEEIPDRSRTLALFTATDRFEPPPGFLLSLYYPGILYRLPVSFNGIRALITHIAKAFAASGGFALIGVLVNSVTLLTTYEYLKKPFPAGLPIAERYHWCQRLRTNQRICV